MYYTIEYDLILIFGITEFQAQVRWFEHVSLLYNFPQILGAQTLRFCRERNAGKFLSSIRHTCESISCAEARRN